MHHKNYKVLPKGRIFFPLFFENTNAWLLGMGGSEITILKLLPAVPRLEDSLTPAPPGGFVTQCAAGLLWGKSMVTIFNHLWTPFTHIRRGVPILYGTFPRQPWTVMATSSSSGHTLTEASRGTVTVQKSERTLRGTACHVPRLNVTAASQYHRALC